MADIGKYNDLEIIEQSDHGLYLDGGTHGKILLPHAYVTADMLIGQTVKVFISNDSDDRLVATTETPVAQVGQFAYLEVVGHKPNIGYFLDWGMGKDLFLPYREKGNLEIEVGDGVIVAIYLDEQSDRIVASAKLHKFTSRAEPEYEPNDPVHVIIYGESPLGYKAIVDRKHRGLLYYTETYDKLEEGDQFTGYIKKVRSGGRIDLRRDPSGYERVEGLAGEILQKLETAGGSLPFNDKSSPESIRETFNTSKKAFKQALGALYKQRRIQFTETGIESV